MFKLSVISPNATFDLSSSQAAVDEGSQVTVTLNTTGVQIGQHIPFTITGEGVTTDDFVALPSLSGDFVVENNQAIKIFTLAEDETTEGVETFTVALENNTSVDVDITDTSVTPVLGPTGNLWRTLNNPAPAANDRFGISVAISGNYAVVGAYVDDPSGISSAGTAYVFDVTTGALVRTLNNPAPATGDQFGISVAISGNYAVVGAYFDDPSGVTDAGTAYVFDVTTGALVRTLNNPAPAASDQFGISVAISGNYAVVGTYADDPSGISNAGTAYVFDVTTGALVRTLNNPAPAASDYFGYSVGISGNYAVVGAYADDPSGISDAGTAYVFNVTTGALVSTLNNPAPAASDYFGYSVAISGNYAVVGAYFDDPSGISSAGTAYVFDVTTGALVRTLNNPAPAASDYFGYSVAISGNYAVVGTYADDPSGISSAGTAYVFDVTTGALVRTLNNPAPTATDYFGISVAISGNYAVVGAYFDDPSGVTDAGTAYIFN